MAPHRSKPLQPSQEERRSFLARLFVDVVEDLLVPGTSYGDLTVGQLISSADISRSTFYVYFDDKADLLRGMAEDVTRELERAGAAWFGLSAEASRADVEGALKTLFTVYRRHSSILGAITEAAAYDPTIREQHQILVQRAIAGLEDHISRHQAEGAADPNLDPAQTARWLVWMFERGLYQFVATAPEAEVDELVASAADFVWRQLYEGYRPSPGISPADGLRQGAAPPS